MSPHLSIKIGGEAGQGIQSVSRLLADMLQDVGLHVFAYQNKESRIRGGHNFVHMAAAVEPAFSARRDLDILICLDAASVSLHSDEVRENGLVLFDPDLVPEGPEGSKYFKLKFAAIAKEKAGSKVMANTVAIGAALAYAGMDFEILSAQLGRFFGSKGEDVVKGNIAAARAGYELAAEYLSHRAKFSFPEKKQETVMLSGAHAIAFGAIASGCSFLSAYPMSPATGIMEYFFAHREDLGLVAVQAEDEIAAINMAIGASYAGVRAMTSTSGGGFSLMVEGLGLAAITETPLVIVEAQRPGPATGLPTRTEQADLLFAIHASQGEFPRAVLTPGTAGQAFAAMSRAFNLAEKYQVPVIVLVDQYITDSIWTQEPFNLDDVTIDRGSLYAGSGDAAEYKRYALAADGISPRAFPGNPNALVYADSDEHDESGRITESAEVRISQVGKRERKFEGLVSEAAQPVLYGPEDYEELVVCWGSVLGAALPALDIYRAGGAKAALLHIEQAWPLTGSAVADAMKKAGRTSCVELNSIGQMARLIRAQTGLEFDRVILKYDGRPFLPEELAEELGKEAH